LRQSLAAGAGVVATTEEEAVAVEVALAADTPGAASGEVVEVEVLVTIEASGALAAAAGGASLKTGDELRAIERKRK
jgi:hypothetical protein